MLIAKNVANHMNLGIVSPLCIKHMQITYIKIIVAYVMIDVISSPLLST
jgi:hypothetical protein